MEFGAKNREFAYRALVYASGRLCVDRLFDTYPEFIHCLPLQPEVVAGESYNELRIRVTGYKVRVWVNGSEVLAFEDDRYEGGSLALAASGPNTHIVFRKWELAGVR